ncbi:MAG: N-acetylmuramoyl-L-alanine amidase, partial [Burkholderiales bacterium]
MPGALGNPTGLSLPHSRQAFVRRLLRVVALIALAASTLSAAATQIAAVRVWPAPEYTRVAIESPSGLTYSVFAISNPERLVVDLEDVEFGRALEELPSKVASDDPYIAGIRTGRFKPGVIRLVFDLKQPINAQVFTLRPVADYGHRLVLDIYPLVPIDPILALLKEKEAASPPSAAPSVPGGTAQPTIPSTGRQPPQPEVERLITVAIDAGHGGEDPGAKGRRGTYEKHVTLAIA